MKLLNNMLKGLTVSLGIILLGGVISLKINVSNPNVLVLVSSSFINTINTDNITFLDNQSDEIDNVEEINEEIIDEKIEEVNEDSKTEVIETNEVIESNDNLENKNNITNDNINSDSNKVEEIEEITTYNPNLEVLNTISTIETYYGKITGYGPDCYGCSGITASGMNVNNGNIYYEDSTFGIIRIVAGDKSLPFGSIIKITGLSISTDPVIAIVLDRGGMIGFDSTKHAYFDLLYESSTIASSFGIQNATFELLRRGY